MADSIEATSTRKAVEMQRSGSTAPEQAATQAPIGAKRAPDPNPKALAIEAKVSQLQSQITDTEAKIAGVKEQLKNPPEATIKRHIKLLHDYNEIRDVAMGLIGMIADQRGVRMRDCLAEFGVEGEGV